MVGVEGGWLVGVGGGHVLGVFVEEEIHGVLLLAGFELVVGGVVVGAVGEVLAAAADDGEEVGG